MNENKEKSLLLTVVPKDVIETHLAPRLGLKELSRLVRTCKKGRDIFAKPLQDAILSQLLELVGFGEQEEAEKLVKKYSKLLLQSGIVRDYSGRIFKDITAFQYALWAYDRHMWNMILKYLPEDKARQQLYDHVYGKKIYKILHKSHFDFDLLVDAIQTMVDKAGIWRCSLLAEDDKRIEHGRKKIGGAQREAPAHVANEYCRKDRSFSLELLLNEENVPRFKEENLPRTLTYVDSENNYKLWFPLEEGKGVGVDLGLMRFHRALPGPVVTFNPALYKVELDAITALRDTRKNEFEELKKNLLGADLVQELDSTSMENPTPSA